MMAGDDFYDDDVTSGLSDADRRVEAQVNRITEMLGDGPMTPLPRTIEDGDTVEVQAGPHHSRHGQVTEIVGNEALVQFSPWDAHYISLDELVSLGDTGGQE